MGVSVNGFITSSKMYQLNLLALLDRVSIFFQEYNIEVNLSLIRNTLLNLPILNWIRSISGGLIGFVGDLLLVLIFTFFLIVGSEAHEGEAGNVVSDEIKNRINRYLTVKFFTSAATAILVGVFYQILDLELALMFALVTFILNFLPTVGSIIATVLPIPIVFIQFGFGWTALIAILIPAAIQFSVGNIIDPKLMGSSLGLHPVVVLLSLLFWGFVWGVAGMFLSVPLTAVLKLILMRFTTTRKIALILEGSV
jgi:AI-2 transport protein TqsA